MSSKPTLIIAALLAAASLAGCEKAEPTSTATTETAEVAGDDAMAAKPGPVRYKVEFTTTWLKTNFPYEYPDTSLLHKPHFSGWIGTGHNDGYLLFKAGDMPTPGLEMLSEMGKHTPLDGEIDAAVVTGHATGLAESEPLRDFSQKASFEIVVDEAHPWASAVAMIAPSPDWFTGFDVNLMENGAWVESKTIDVMAWDSGGDDGATFLADDADSDPKKPVAPASVMQFMKDGKVMPVGTVTLTRM